MTTTPLNNRTRVRLYGALCVQRGTPMLQTYATARTVEKNAKIDIWDPDTEEGYQRSLVTTRIAQTADYYDVKGGRMPNPLLVNIREEDFDDVSVEITNGEGGASGYEAAIANKTNWTGVGFIEFPPGLGLWVYDGQHRKAGLQRLLDRVGDAYEDFPVPLSLTLGLDRDDEMREFYEVNTNAKSVNTNLVFELLTKMSENDPEMADLLAVGERDWIVRGNKVAKVLEDMDGPWRDRFQLANKRKRKGDGVVIPLPQFIRSLKPVLDMPLLKRAEPETIAELINAYWTGISQVLPEPFDGNPESYVIQKGQGTTALHRVLPQVIEVVRANNDKLGSPESYAKVLTRLPQLRGTAVVDGQQEERDGAEFWEVGSVASGFSGDAGRRRLGLLIQSLLPAPSDTLTL
jgi:DGQHR domain-containing protein